jgi:hypothetical protein
MDIVRAGSIDPWTRLECFCCRARLEELALICKFEVHALVYEELLVCGL